MVALAALMAADPGMAQRRFPNILILSVDTLRLDRMSGYGYSRPTTPHLDALMRRGVRFDQARTVEPLTAPAMASIFTGLHPHDHGASRNGLQMRPGLPSWTKMLGGRGYRTSGIVGNWTLRPELSGMEEHFEHYQAVLNRKRWGLFLGEATAKDLNEASLAWLDRHLEAEADWPFLLWVHYVEPHAPYRFQDKVASRLGKLEREKDSDRYDTEVAFVDQAIGDLLADVRMRVPSEDLLIVFLADHGESLGEHGYWGHGRNLHEPNLHIPMAIVWEGRLQPQVIATAPASNLDIASTVVGLLGLEVPSGFAGYDWTPVFSGATPPESRITYHQAHKGAVQRRKNTNARRQGLLEVGIVDSGRKEILRVKNRQERRLFDLSRDPGEQRSEAQTQSPISGSLQAWLDTVRKGLVASDELPAPSLDDESLEQLRALGYID